MTILFSMLFALTVYKEKPAIIGIGSNVTDAQEHIDLLCYYQRNYEQHKKNKNLIWTEYPGWGSAVRIDNDFLLIHNGFFSYLPHSRWLPWGQTQLATERLIAEHKKVFTDTNQVSQYGSKCTPYEEKAIKASSTTFEKLKEELEEKFGDKKPMLSRVLPREKTLQILKIQSLWKAVQNASFKEKISSSLDHEVLPWHGNDRYPVYQDMPKQVGPLHGNILLLQKPDFFPLQTAKIIQYSIQSDACPVPLYCIDDRWTDSKNALEFGIPLLQYTSSQSYTPTDEARQNIQKSLAALQKALFGALQNSTTPISQSTSFDIPEAFYIPDKINVLQNYIEFLYEKLANKINVEKMSITSTYRGDVGSMNEFTISNFSYISSWIKDNFKTGVIDVTTDFNKLFKLVFAPPEQGSHFLDPYHLVWYLKALIILSDEINKQRFASAETTALVVSFSQSLQQFLTIGVPAQENTKRYIEILKQMIPRLEYYLQERTDFKQKPDAFPLLDFEWR